MEITVDIIKLINTVLDQRYLCHKHEYNTQDEELAMGSPASAILSEIIYST
jgi:hypothetical protein